MRKLLRCIMAVCALWAGTASGQLVDVINEVVASSPNGGFYPPIGYSTYRIYARLEDPTDRINAVFGSTTPSPVHHLQIGSTDLLPAVWNTSFGGYIMDQLNAALFGVFPEIQWDSAVTIGKTSSADPGGQIFTISNPPNMVQAAYSSALATGFNEDLLIVDGAWFVVNDGSINGFPTGPDNRILIAQVTVPTGTLFYNLNISIFDEAVGENQLIYVHNLQDAPGMVGVYPEVDGTCLGLVFPLPSACGEGVPGCTDALACNFDPAATEDDGSCTYPGCTDPAACNFDDTAGCDNGLCEFPGCTNPLACNFDLLAGCDDGSCTFPGCTDPDACNYDSTAGCDNGLCTYPGCVNPLACNFDVLAGCDDGSCTFAGCTDPTACNYDSTAGCDNGLCNYPGCTNPLACNFDILAGCDDGLCTFPGCTDESACNYDSTAGCDNGLCTYPGCTDPLANNFDPTAGCNDGSCTYDEFGCTDETACNFDPNATIEDGTCTYPGCNDPAACNFNDLAGCSDGSCEYLTCAGCTDVTACNFDPTATINDGSCTYPGCTDESACNFDPEAGCLEDLACTYPGCTDPLANNFDPAAGCDDGSCTYDEFGCTDETACNFDPNATIDDGSCTYPGCTNPLATNFDPEAGCDDGSCVFAIPGCTDDSACNFNPLATTDDGSCTYPGCTNPLATNYDPAAGCDDGSCEFATEGCTDDAACNYNPLATTDDGSCTYPGCNVPTACNYDPTAGCSDGSCTFPGCNDLSACNYNPNAGCNNGSCTYPGCTDPQALNYDPTAGCGDPAEYCTYDGGECFFVCPADAVVECGDDTSPASTGSAFYTAGCPENSVWYVDGETTGDDCVSSFVRTWYGLQFIISGQVGGGEIIFDDTCEQLITIADTDGPVFDNVPDDITVTCLDLVPDAAEVTATDDCNGVVSVEVFTQDNGFVSQECEATTAMGPGADWAVWLPNLPGAASDYWVFDGNGTIHFFADGTAHVFGLLVNAADNTQMFELNMYLENQADWATWSGMGRSYKDDLNLATPGQLYEAWQFFEIVGGFSNLSGVGAWAGSDLFIYHFPVDYYFGFQVGDAANNKNANYGASAWFTYNGWVNGVYAEGNGDINVDLECGPFQTNDCPEGNTSVTYLWMAEDECGNISFASQVITVDDTVNPVFENCPEDVTVECYDEVAGINIPNTEDLYGFDNCDPDTLWAVQLGEPVTTGDLCTGSITYLWYIEDCNGNRDYCEFVINWSDDEAPVITGQAEIVLECGDAIPFIQPTATDNCDDNVTITYTDTDMSDEAECPLVGHIIRHFTATDDCGNSSTFNQHIYIYDTQDPVFESTNTEIWVECSELDTVEDLVATDDCSDVTVTYEDVCMSGGCLGVIQRTYTATDECGNTATAILYIHVLDTTPPVINCPEDLTVECDDVPSIEELNVTATDECDFLCIPDYDLGLTAISTIVPGECEDSYDIVISWSATDYCGNVATCSTTIHVQDTTAPVYTFVPEGVTIECDEDLPALVYPIAVDNCADTVDIILTVETIPGECPQEYTLQRIFRAYDNCGNFSMYVQNIVVEDTTAPEFEGQDMITIECNDEIPLIQPTATDNCDPFVTVTYSDAPFTGGFECPYVDVVVRTFTGTDDCGNVATFVQWIWIQDTTGPIFTGDATIELPCDNYAGVYVTAIDECTSVVSLDYSDQFVPGDCQGQIIRTYVAIDECDNATTFVQTITLTDIVPPVVSEPEDFTIECGLLYIVPTPEASDNCDPELTMTSDSDTDTDGCTTWVTYTWTFTDNCDNSTTVNQVVTIVDTTAPYFTFVPFNSEVSCEDELPFVLATASDICDEEVPVTWSDSTIPGECPQSYTVQRQWIAVDDCGNADTAYTFLYVYDVEPPVFTFVPADDTVECDMPIPFVWATATDNCGDVDVTYSDTTFTQGPCFSWILRTFVATDECGNVSYEYQNIYIEDTTPPVITGEVNIPRPCDDFTGIYITAVDNCSELVFYSYDDTFVSGSCQGHILRDYTVWDICFNYAYFQQIITLTDTVPPVVNEPVDFTVECEEPFVVITPFAADNCDFEVSVDADTTTVSEDCITTITYTWTFTDNCMNSTTVDQVVTITDTTAPYFTFVPGTVEVSCEEETLPFVQATAADICDEDVDVNWSDSTVPGECPQSYTVVRQWIAIDDCGNADTAYSYINVVDNVPPVFTFVPADDTVECDMPIPFVWATATDNCGDVDVTYSDTTFTQGICFSWVLRTFVATDECGNVSYEYQNIYIEDTTAPVITGEVNIERPCDDFTGIYITAVDNCSELVFYSYDDTFVSGSCQGHILRNYTVWDICFNYAYFQQIITLTDTVPPVVNEPVDFEVECTEPYVVFAPFAFDNCDFELSLDSDTTTVVGDCITTVTYTWTYTDNCENSTSVNQVVTIVDTTAPYFTFVPGGGEYSCDEEIPFVAATAADLCDEDVDVSSSDNILPGECPQSYTIARQWIAVDNCGNADTAYTYFYVGDWTAPVINGTVADTTVQCYGDIPAIVTLTATDNCGDATVTVNTDVVTDDECGNTVIDVCYVASDECGNTSSLCYTITVLDTIAPVLVGCPLDTVLACDATLPEPAVVTATDNCDESVEVIYNEYFYGEVPEEGQGPECDLITPNIDDAPNCNSAYSGTSWALWLGGLTEVYRYYEVIDGSFEQFDDGTAHLSATFQLNGIGDGEPVADGGFIADIWFYNGMDWTAWDNLPWATGYKADCAALGAEHESWMYYLMNNDMATLTGYGDLAGSFFTLTHAPSNNYFGYQVGLGANNFTPGYGSGGWFEYVGTLTDNSNDVTIVIEDLPFVNNAGDIALEQDCCPDYWVVREWCAVDCSGNWTCCSQMITFEGTEIPGAPQAPGLEPVVTAIKDDFDFVTISPNPTSNNTVIEFTTKVDDRLSMEAYDMAGRKVGQLFSGQVQEGQTYRVNFDTQRLEDGIYQIRLFSASDSRMKKLIVER